MDESFDFQICPFLSDHQLEIKNIDIFHENFADQGKKEFKTHESIQVFNEQEKELFALFELESNFEDYQINKSFEKKIKDRESQQKYRNQIKSVVKKIKEYDVDFFKEWQKEISFQTIALDHVEKIIGYYDNRLDKDDPYFEERSYFKKSLISFCKDKILRSKYKIKNIDK